MEILKVNPELTSLLKNVCNKEQISDFTITDIQTKKKGEGWMGDIFMINIKDNHSDKKLNVVVKSAYTDENARKLAPVEMAFKNEIIFYQHVTEAFEKLNKDHNLTEYTELVPKLLDVHVKGDEIMLVLENLKYQNFEVYDKTTFLDHDHVELIFKNYGRLHAYSYAMRHYNPEEYSKLIGQFYNIDEYYMVEGFFADYIVEVGKLIQSALIPGEDDEIIEEFKKYEGRNIVNKLQSSFTKNCDYSAILHGDCWTNNMLFKYQEPENGRKPCEIRLIDWQFMKSSSPVCDLSYCLYTGATKDIYDNIHNYLKIYHESLSLFLKRLNCDPEKLFPFTALEDHWNKYSKFGMIMAFGVFRARFTYSDTLKDFTDGLDKEELLTTLTKGRFNEEEFNKRVRDILRHVFENGAL